MDHQARTIVSLGSARRKAVAGLALLLLLLAWQQFASAHTGSAAVVRLSAKPANGLPLNLVILVDESGSESAGDIANESEAASTISQSLLSDHSRVSVVGFGGADPVAPKADATSIVCRPTVTSGTTNLEYLARCVSGLHPRTASEGNNTDYYGALGQAISILSSQPIQGGLSVILMMTDGALDEKGNKNYPQPDWESAAHIAIDRELAGAAQAHDAIWPLGFGEIDATSHAYLQHLADRGSQVTCDGRTVSAPRARVVEDSAQALTAFDTMYSAAACVGTSHGGPERVPNGQSATMAVTIPPIASTAAISVYKASPRVRVDFIAPDGTPVPGGTLDGSQVVLSGQDTKVEVLHILDPPSGAWRIRLTAPPGHGGELVTATVFWQGQIRTSVTASPSTAAPGQQVSVTVTVLGRNHPITDPAELAGVQVQVTVSGDSLPSPIPVRLTQRSGPGTTAGDFTGTFRAPSTKGLLTVSGTATGYGLHTTRLPAFVSVVSATQVIQATVQFSASDSVQSGSSVPGEVLFNNQTGRSEQARLVLATGSALATIASPTGSLRVPPGRSARHFTIHIASGSPTGSAQLTVAAVNASQPATRYGNNVLVVTITKPPPLPLKYLPELIALVVLALLAAGRYYGRRRDRLRMLDVRGLVAVLTIGPGLTAAELRAPGKRAGVFRFFVDKPAGGHPLLTRQGSGAGYSARRDGQGNVVVKTPDGTDHTVSPGGQGTTVADDLVLTFSDRRSGKSPAAARPDRDSGGGASLSDHFRLDS